LTLTERQLPLRRYLDDMEIQELVDLESSAQRKSEAKQLAAEAEEQIMHDHYDEGLAKYTEAIKLDPDSKTIADQRKTAQEKAAEAKKSKDREIAALMQKGQSNSMEVDKKVKIAKGRAAKFIQTKEWDTARTEAKNALALIDDSHKWWDELKGIQTEAEHKSQASEILQQSKHLTAAGDFEGAEARHAEVERLDPTHPELAGIKKAHAAKIKAAQTAIDAKEAAVLAQHEQAEEKVEAAKAAAAAEPEPEPEQIEIAAPVRLESLAMPADKDALGNWAVDNDVQVRGLTNQGTVGADFGFMETCFGAPRASDFKGIEWRLMGTFMKRNLICQITAATGTDEWFVKGMDHIVVPFVQTILDTTRDDMTRSHVSTDQAESFRLDHDVNIKAATPQGNIRTTYDLMRYTFGEPKPKEVSQSMHCIVCTPAATLLPLQTIEKPHE
jgi:hypothetical protein